MPRFPLTYLLFLCLAIPSAVFAGDRLNALEAVVHSNARVQPGLESFQVTIETPRIGEMISRMTADIPSKIAKPAIPVVIKYWQREPYQSIVATLDKSVSPYVEQMVERASDNLAVELDRLLLPVDRAEQRRKLVASATIKSSEVALAQTLLRRVEIVFEQPTDLDQAFYVTALRLPQKQVRTLTFDIDTKTQTIGEMTVATEAGLVLSVEIRYLEVTNGYLPNRIQITSPDGKIDDLFEVQFTKVADFLLPATMQRTTRRPDLQDDLKITFKNYQINQPAAEIIRNRLAQP